MRYLLCTLLLFAIGCEVHHTHEVKPLKGNIKIDVDLNVKHKHKDKDQQEWQ